MYTYKVYNKYSTKLSQVQNEEDKCIGYIHKTYNNSLEKIIDFIGKGSLINRFEVLNSNKEVVFKAKRGNSFKWRKYDVKYFYDNKSFEFEMKQKDFIKISDCTRFSFNGKDYNMKQTFGNWAEITEEQSGKTIAKWKVKFVRSFYGNFEVLDESFEKHQLLLLGVFHTYFYGE